MTPTKNTPMIVEKAANGFIVRPLYTSFAPIERNFLDVYIFYSIEEVTEFMNLNFTEDKND